MVADVPIYIAVDDPYYLYQGDYSLTMPYSSNDDLPEAVRKALPSHGQSIFLSAFNSAFEGSCKERENREGCASAIAWAAVKRAYRQDEKGDWHPIEHKGCEGGRCVFEHLDQDKSTHRAVGQVLNRWHRNKALDRDLFYSTDNFTGTEREWDTSAPLIFAQQHPDARLVATNLDEALKSVTAIDGGPGRVAGRLKETTITTSGQPRMEHDVVFDDPQMNDRWERGELSLSSCWVGHFDNEGNILGKVKPNHMLVFVQDKANQPGDPGAMFLHKRSEDMSDDKTLEGLIGSLRSLFSGRDPKKENDMTDADLEKRFADLEATTAGMTEKLTVANKLAEDLKAERDLLSQEVETLRAERADSKWAAVKNKIPKGWMAKEGAEAELRKEFESDPVTFAHKLLEAPRGDKKKEEGTAFAHGKTGDSDMLAAATTARELRAMTGRR